jgi:hypothetical protein
MDTTCRCCEKTEVATLNPLPKSRNSTKSASIGHDSDQGTEGPLDRGSPWPLTHQGTTRKKDQQRRAQGSEVKRNSILYLQRQIIKQKAKRTHINFSSQPSKNRCSPQKKKRWVQAPPPGIEPETFRLQAVCMSNRVNSRTRYQLRHRGFALSEGMITFAVYDRFAFGQVSTPALEASRHRTRSNNA